MLSNEPTINVVRFWASFGGLGQRVTLSMTLNNLLRSPKVITNRTASYPVYSFLLLLIRSDYSSMASLSEINATTRGIDRSADRQHKCIRLSAGAQVCSRTISRMYQLHSSDTCLVCHFVVQRQELQYSR